MKKSIKIFLTITCFLTIVIIGFLVYSSAILTNVNLDEKKLVNVRKTITFYDDNNQQIDEQSNGISISNFNKIPTHTINAFISIEDKRFYKHNGIDTKGLFRALFNNVKTLSLKEGASTISQQLIKNTHLSSEKTLKRKLSEIKLAKQLENKFSKNEILEKYLNTIYFGDGCYGISSASEHYFNTQTENLTINQSAILAGLIKAPYTYSPYENPEKCFERKNLVLNEMYKQEYISKEILDVNLKMPLQTQQKEKEYNFDYLYLAKKEVENTIKNIDIYKNLKVYTYLDSEIQEIITEQIKSENTDKDKSLIILDNKNKIKGYYSTCGEQNRQIGSTIKPILVYAPALECNLVHSCSQLIDEKTNFNGYQPSNFNDIYYGKVSVKESLAKSMNVCSIKLLNYVGIERAKSYANKTLIPLSEQDNSLGIALGSTEKGAKLSEITASYNVFNNKGNIQNKSCIKKIVDNTGKIIYKDTDTEQKVFNNATISIMNDMLRYTVTDGTARKLNNLPFEICGKTGTVGNKNGNSDAYCISYNPNYTIGCWCGYQNGKTMSNDITGGTTPTTISYNTWNKIYQKTEYPKGFELNEDVVEIEIDKISLIEDDVVEIADFNAPDRYKSRELFSIYNIPQSTSTRFTKPKIKNVETLLNNNGFSIRLCVAEYIEAEIYRENNGKKIKLFDTKNNVKYILDTNIPSGLSIYSIVPYYTKNNVKYYGEEVIIDKIKTPEKNFEGNWWLDD